MNTLNLGYLFFVSDINAITRTEPSILQRIADGESQNKGGNVVNARIPTASAFLKVKDLSGKTIKPLFLQKGIAV